MTVVTTEGKLNWEYRNTSIIKKRKEGFILRIYGIYILF